MLSLFVLKALASILEGAEKRKMEYEKRKNTNERSILFCRETKAIEKKVT